MSRNTGNKTNGKAVSTAERQRRALELRKAGATFDAIAKQCGYRGAQGAHEAVKKAIRDIPRDAAIDVRQLELERLDRLMLAYWPRAIGGDADAAGQVLRIMGLRCKLSGIDAAPPINDQRGEAPRLVVPEHDPRYLETGGLPAEAGDPNGDDAARLARMRSGGDREDLRRAGRGPLPFGGRPEHPSPLVSGDEIGPD